MSAIDQKYAAHDDFALLEQMAELTKGNIPKQFVDLKNKEILHKKVVEIGEMKNAVLNII
jgi:threonine synthase